MRHDATSRFPATLLACALAALPGYAWAAGTGGAGGGTSYGGLGSTGDGGGIGNAGQQGAYGTPGGGAGTSGLNGMGNGGDGSLSTPPSIIAVGQGGAYVGGGGGGGGTMAIDNDTGQTSHGGKGGNGAAFTVSASSSNGGISVGGGGGQGGTIQMFTGLLGDPVTSGARVRGGDGGIGADVSGAVPGFTNTGIIWGGGGGAGGVLLDSIRTYLGSGGNGGTGLQVSRGGINIHNQGEIHGGNGGGGGGGPGLGGVGLHLIGDGAQVTQGGIIRGGLAGDGVTRADAVRLTGADNVLTLMSGSTTIGNVTFAGTGNTLRLGSGATATASITGNVTFGSDGVYQVRATNTGFDRLNITGTADLAGARVAVSAVPGAYNESFSQPVLHADGTLQGSRFTGVTTDLAYLTPTLSYSQDDQDVILTLTRAPSNNNPGTPSPDNPGTPPPIRFAELVIGGNARAVADAVETLSGFHPIYDAAIGLPRGAPQGFFSALSGEAHAGVASGLANLAGTVRTVPLSQLRGNLNAGMIPGSPTAAAGASDAAPSAAALPASLARPAWAQVVGNWQRIGATADTAAVRQHTGGVFAGADGALGNGWRLGGALGYTDSRMSVDDLASKADVSSYSAALYGGKAFALGAGKLNLMAGASYTWHDVSTRRRIAAGGLDQTLTADYGASTTQLFSEIGYAFDAARGLTLEPYAGVAWAGQRTRAFSERGGSAALSGEASRNNTTTTTLGLRAAQQLQLGTLSGTVHAGLGWRHAFGDIRPESRLAFDAGESFTVTGAPIARNAALAELGFDATVSRNATLGLAYAGQFGDGNRDHTATVILRWAF